jgi:hypothetical protein
MTDEKNQPVEEAKWWIDRGPVKERDKDSALGRGIIEKWTYELLKDYSQERAVRNVVDLNPKFLKEITVGPGEWQYLSLGVGNYPPDRLAKIKGALKLISGARGLIIDAGYSARVMITGEPIGERLIDINFTEGPSVDFWVRNELIEEKLFRSGEATLRYLQTTLPNFLNPPKLD